MAYPSEWWRSRRLFRGEVPARVERGINWLLFIYCFEIAYSRHMVAVRTPWFQVILSSGEQDFTPSYYVNRWYGIRAYWGHPRNWNIDNAGILFKKSDLFLSFNKPEMQRYY